MKERICSEEEEEGEEEEEEKVGWEELVRRCKRCDKEGGRG